MSTPLQAPPIVKTVALTAVGVIIALSALTASLPLNLISHQPSMAANEAILNQGDTAWMIVATIFGFFLSPALAYLYATLHGSNVSELMKTVLLTGAVVTFVWILFTFSLSYGKDAKGNGLLGYPISYYMFKDTTGETAGRNNAASIPNSIYAVYELGFALLTPTIIAASLAGRVNLNGFLFFIFVWHVVVYTVVAHVMWSDRGAFYTNWIKDFSGGIVVHVLAAITAINVHIVLGKDTIPKSAPVAKPDKALFLTLVVWFLWFGFNAGKAHSASAVAAQSVVNTIAATFVAVLMGFLYNLIMEKPTTPVTLSSSILIGLISITSASGYVTVGGAMCISLCTYLLTIVIAHFVLGEGAKTNEPLGIASTHASAGTIGFLWTAIISYKFVNPEGVNGLTYGRGIPLAYQLSAALAAWGCIFIATFIIAFLSNLLVPMSATPEEIEYKSADAAEDAAPKEPAAGETSVELTAV